MFFATLTPVMLLLCGAVLSYGIGLPHILRPKTFLTALQDRPKTASATKGATSATKAMTVALAGTLGVGNITGVSSAILQGGVGAVFWMWIGALFSMAVKYGEVALAVLYRKRRPDGQYIGGMMYVLRDGLPFGKGISWTLGGAFALLCVANALVTGTLVQSHAAACVVPFFSRSTTGLLLALLVLLAILYGTDRVGDITLGLIPILSGGFLLLSLWIIVGHIPLLPSILREILREAFALSPTVGAGSAMQGGFFCAMRYGITRGIFSNEAGCGTSPTAHAAAETKSPFHQGCFGILEVICDTPVFCTCTALVLCIADRRFGILSSGTEDVVLRAFAGFGGTFVYGLLAGMVLLFAYATILAQLYYGSVALQYFRCDTILLWLYRLVTVAVVVVGSVIEGDVMWQLADGLIGVMTCMNTAVLLFLRREIVGTVPGKEKK